MKDSPNENDNAHLAATKIGFGGGGIVKFNQWDHEQW